MPSAPYEIQYSREAVGDIRGMCKYDQKMVLDRVEAHLAHQPTFVSKSRIKAMNQPFWSQYRLRVDDYRVYYDVDEKERIVSVLRVLIKTTGQTPEKIP
jgi:mRNA-degrading endonuclease RelE of RelBE toxin-antitoxin system